MDQRKKTARIAGLLYLIVVICGTLYLQYIPSKFKFKGDSSVVIHNFIAYKSLFRIGIISELICWVAFLILPVVLYKLLKPVNEIFAKVMVAFAVVQVPIAFINLS